MYESFYHLDGNPFRLVPDTRFCFQHPSYDEAQAYLEYAFKLGEGFVIFTGRPGTGKTTLVQSFLKRLRLSQVHAARIAVTNLNATELLRSVANAFGLESEGCDKVILLHRLEQHFLGQVRAGKRNLLIIDEAQGLSMNSLEELRMLADLQTESRFLLQIFLVGHDKLREFMVSPDMEQFQQRVAGTCKLVPLALKECRSYIEYRLCQVGWKGDPVFTGPAVQAIHRYSEGVPRHINKVCTRLLLHGLLENSHELDEADVLAVARGLEEELLAPLSATRSAASEDQAAVATVNDNDDVMAPASGVDRLEIRHRESSAPLAPPSPEPGDEPARQEKCPDARFSEARARPAAPVSAVGTEVSDISSRFGISSLYSATKQLKQLLSQRSRRNFDPALLLSLSALVVFFMLVSVFNNEPAGGDGTRSVRSDTYDTWVQVTRYRDGEYEEFPVYDEPDFVRENRARRAAEQARRRAAEGQPGSSEAVAVAASEHTVRESVPLTPVKPERAEPVAVASLTVGMPDPSETQAVPVAHARHSIEPVLTDVSMPRPAETEAMAVAKQAAVEEPAVEPRVEAVEVDRAPATVSTTALAEEPAGTVVQEPATVVRADQIVQVEAVDMASLESHKTSEVARLLSLARQSVRDYRLLIPAGNNAYEYYGQVDALDPGNKEAARGIDSIVSRYFALAERAIARDEMESARSYIDRGLTIQPADEELLALQTALVEPRIQYVEVVASPEPVGQSPESAPDVTLFSKIKTFFEQDQIGVSPNITPWNDEEYAW